jgi:hypothetical protein
MPLDSGSCGGQRIAILGWGSLIYCPRSLVLERDWQPDGPWLPIEFARISRGPRLTLVIMPGRKLIRTYWALSGLRLLEAAIRNLAAREGTDRRNIGYLRGDGAYVGRFPQYRGRLLRWLRSVGSEAVIWTDLESNFELKAEKPFSLSNAVEYLKDLTGKEGEEAEKYVRRAPAQTDTPLRRRLRKEFGWTAWQGSSQPQRARI